MLIRSGQEALFVACQMEQSAVQLYGRALMLMERLERAKEPLYERLRLMKTDEEEHLRQFLELYGGLDASVERELELAAVAEGVLFEGGMMGAARRGLLQTVDSMLELAMRAEKASALKYREFAALTDSEEARDALLLIAGQEEKHLRDLEEQATA